MGIIIYLVALSLEKGLNFLNSRFSPVIQTGRVLNERIGKYVGMGRHIFSAHLRQEEHHHALPENNRGGHDG
jgi:hypothetical protein